MTEQTEIARIAAGLDTQQKRYMVGACEPCQWEDDRLWMNVTSPGMMSYLVRSGCHRALDHDLMIMALSGVGLAVRALLEQEQSDG